MHDSYTRAACGITRPGRLENLALDAVGILAGVAFLAAKGWMIAQALGVL